MTDTMPYAHLGEALATDYLLVREHDTVRERTLQITFLDPGAQAYVFTFG